MIQTATMMLPAPRTNAIERIHRAIAVNTSTQSRSPRFNVT